MGTDMNPTLEIFSQGEEIVTGQTVDTNAAWLSQQAINLGFTVTRHTAVGDKLEDLVALLKEIARRADCCICTGGLGPTIDDLTAEAVAQAFALPLVFDEMAFAQIQQFFIQRQRVMPALNRKQAMLPLGALRLDNEWGTAPGFSLQYGGCWLVFLPGVPSEMKPMFLEKILPLLPIRFALKPNPLVCIKTFGIGESDIQQRIDSIKIPASVQLGFRASLMDVQTKLLFPSGFPKPERTTLIDNIVGLLGDAVFSIGHQGEASNDLPGVVDHLMNKGQHTLAVLETASQGLLASMCIGADWLLESGFGQPLERIGQKMGITIDTGNLYETAKQLAVALQKTSQAEFTLVQLYAGGRNAFNDKKQSITIYNALLTKGGYQQTTHIIAGTIKRKQNQAALLSLDMLRRYLQFGQ